VQEWRADENRCRYALGRFTKQKCIYPLLNQGKAKLFKPDCVCPTVMEFYRSNPYDNQWLQVCEMPNVSNPTGKKGGGMGVLPLVTFLHIPCCAPMLAMCLMPPVVILMYAVMI
jgi:hypothetical protein